ncbi:Putative transmembrane protein (Alph_Pro_TM) [Roseivivax jejudonensis]|uniref:Putative transmembrane protein (Alph_Pro_TM) n=1 Tax=Roseivivax jejudonensis TaxID=1529041 RepID=A0A1X6YAL2_9RHOB|nr:TIGR02186 family protein [Roseivivax jejudonensis]SLN15190.1 Putative transmembrane protein (Alph_Pro_TM) [Roseivivax jejudonensis]
MSRGVSILRAAWRRAGAGALALALLLVLRAGAPAHAQEEVVLGLSQDSVSISTDFDGSEILVYGAVKREVPIPSDPPLEVVVTVSGPFVPLTVYRKERRFGIWVNTDAVEVDLAPSFYAVATSGPFSTVLSNVEDLRHSVSVPRAIRSVGAPMNVEDAQAFSDAVIRIRSDTGLYQMLEGSVDVREETLFATRIRLPANLTEGAYATRIFLTRAGRVVAEQDRVIDVRKVGLERWLYNLSRDLPLAYGLLSLTLAIAAGWGASTLFRLIRN